MTNWWLPKSQSTHTQWLPINWQTTTRWLSHDFSMTVDCLNDLRSWQRYFQLFFIINLDWKELNFVSIITVVHIDRFNLIEDTTEYRIVFLKQLCRMVRAIEYWIDFELMGRTWSWHHVQKYAPRPGFYLTGSHKGGIQWPKVAHFEPFCQLCNFNNENPICFG